MGSLPSISPHKIAERPDDLIPRLPVRGVVSAAHYVTDLTLGLGEVVFDYLA
jgi:acetoacetate decarboxylase